ncbi:hypothetical protein CBM2586_B90132 [Cupriavidus phytorum]|uniref:Uncharacterized protein n=1 Tax=Cupriavidus taiwanensis TaxID=164546 RepID=A0A375CNB0_9BURK|nr:hypothetical protein CBM2586_B90132 [Cupriavidus taiwanensis]
MPASARPGAEIWISVLAAGRVRIPGASLALALVEAGAAAGVSIDTAAAVLAAIGSIIVTVVLLLVRRRLELVLGSCRLHADIGCFERRLELAARPSSLGNR